MRTVLVVVAYAVLAACGSDSSTGVTLPSPVGSWNLSTINGAALPYTLSSTGPFKSELTGSTLIVSAGGSYTATFNLRSTVNGTVTTSSSSDAGTYVTSGTAITLRSNSDGSLLSGAVAANTLTLAEVGGAYVFIRQ